MDASDATSPLRLGEVGDPSLAVRRGFPFARSYSLLGVEVSRETLSLVALALAAGIVIGARIQKTTDRLTPCEDCERHKADTAASIRRGAADFERIRNQVRRPLSDTGTGGGGESGGSEGDREIIPPPAPSPTGPARDEPPQTTEIATTADGEALHVRLPSTGVQKDELIEAPVIVHTSKGGSFPFVPPDNPIDLLGESENGGE